MSDALAILPVDPPSVTADQLALIKATIAKDATPTELQLFFYDCRRQGVHPLDKLIHFTKRSGKYTPITSIDFMRQRAASTGVCAGIDDAIFTGSRKTDDFAATVTVYRFVQGTRCAYTATARWSEYKPEANDFMWQRMPHTMLGKCAEALALRKGFPQQLAGLYAKEELDQADVLAPAGPVAIDRSTGEVLEGTATGDGLLRVTAVHDERLKNGTLRYVVTFSDGRKFSTLNSATYIAAQEFLASGEAVDRALEDKGRFVNLKGVTRAGSAPPKSPDPVVLPDAADIPF